MFTGTVEHHVQMDGDREVHIIPDGGVFDVYYVKEGSCLMYAFGLLNYQPCENKYYDLEDAFHIAWDNFSEYEEMFNYD